LFALISRTRKESNPMDFVKAAISYRKSAEQGDASAQYNLGIMCDHGRGVPQDYAQAAFWYRKAAEQGYAPAQSNLGAAYFEGQGVLQDYAQAAAWFHKAAAQGDATAQFNLGAAYLDGKGLTQDYAAASYWLDRAASGKLEGINAEEIAKLKAEAASHLSPAVLAEAQERWRKQSGANSAESVAKQGPSLPPQPQPFEPFQHPRLVVGAFNLFQQLFMLLVGGWAIILVQVLVNIPVLAVGLVVYALRRRSVLPHEPLAVKCDVCDQPAVGYKELHVDTGLLMVFHRFWSRGFLCKDHTTEYVTNANELNLLGMFLKVGGPFVIGTYIRSSLQRGGNIPVIPRLAGVPDTARFFPLAAQLYLSGSAVRDFDFSREFMLRAAKANSERQEFVLLCMGCATAAYVAFRQGSERNSLALMTEAEAALRRALEASSSAAGLSEEEVSLGRAIHSQVEKLIAMNKKPRK
jgi:hypothetical protein